MVEYDKCAPFPKPKVDAVRDLWVLGQLNLDVAPAKCFSEPFVRSCLNNPTIKANDFDR